MKGQSATSESLFGETGRMNANAPKSVPAARRKQMVIMAVVIVEISLNLIQFRQTNRHRFWDIAETEAR